MSGGILGESPFFRAGWASRSPVFAPRGSNEHIFLSFRAGEARRETPLTKRLVEVVCLDETDAGAAIDSADYRGIAAGSQDS